MDPTDFLSIRFHFNGEFIQEGRAMHYVGGKEEMSYVERERLSMVEEQEKPKSTRVSKVGTIIKCSLCKRSGHNKTSCYKRHGMASTSTSAAAPPSTTTAHAATAAPAGSANPPVSQQSAAAPTANATTGSTANKGKRKATSQHSSKATHAESSKKRSSSTSGNTVNVHGFGRSSVTINVSSGSSSAQAINNPPRRYPVKKYAKTRRLLGLKN